MKLKTQQELEANYEKFIQIIKKYFKGERLEKLLHMYSMEELGGNLAVSPASGNSGYHNCYPGGYIDHIFNVCKNSLRVKQMFIEMGGKPDFTDEEMIFAALHHDLGKLGTKDNLHYIPNDSEWHVKNQGKLFKSNDKITYMTLTDRTFFTLNHYGIQYNEKEYFGIKLTDGMFDEDNQKYLTGHNGAKAPKYKIQYILHWADWMSTVIERQNNEI